MITHAPQLLRSASNDEAMKAGRFLCVYHEQTIKNVYPPPTTVHIFN